MKVKKFGKRAFAVLLTVLLVLSAVPLCAGAVEDTSDFKYELHDDGTATITRYRGSASSLVIPSEIDGYKVTSIGYESFGDCTSLISITIPDSVTMIDIRAFANCTSLVSITIPDSVTSIDSEAFGNCTSLANLYDISLTKDGEKVQHEGMAEVKIPCDNENAKVYRVENDNTLTDMNAVYTDGNLVFHTEHFSLYIVAEEKKETETVGDMNRDGKLDVTDVTAIQIELANTGTDYYDTVADTDKDGKVDVADVTYLQQFIADTIIKF